MTLLDALARLAEQAEGRGMWFEVTPRVVEKFSFETIHREAFRRAAFFAKRGIRIGERVGLVLPNPREFVASFLGIVVAGGVPVPLAPPAGTRSVGTWVASATRILTSAGASMVLTEPACWAGVERLIQDRPELEVGSVEEEFRGDTPSFQAPQLDENNLCFLQFTSGSTTAPRGVEVRHRNIAANAAAIFGEGGLAAGSDDITIAWLPLFHDMGLIGFVLAPIMSGVQSVVLRTNSFLRDPLWWLESIERFRGTITFAPNFAYARTLRYLSHDVAQGIDLSTLRIAGCGGEPINADTLRAFSAALQPAGMDPCAVLPSFGLAESTLAVSFHKRGTPLIVDRIEPDALTEGVARPALEGEESLELVGCGAAFPDHAIAIVDPATDELVEERRVGEIRLSGPSVSSGYFDNPKASEQTWRDGWLRTGDLGYLADGVLFICGRIKELIVVHGLNHYPQDLEWSLTAVSGFRPGKVVAFGAPCASAGERVVIAVESTGEDLEALQRGGVEHLRLAHGLASEVVVLPKGTLPRTSSGKLQRSRVRMWYERGVLGAKND